jgi:hypothetical protein
MVGMRLTEYIDFITRTDLKLGRNPRDSDYSHFTPYNVHKRQRYLYQCKLRGKEPVK